TSCCVQRRQGARCWNPQLSLLLVKLEYSGASIEEVWLVREATGLRYAIVYNLSSGTEPLTPLQLDWRSDGLGFTQGGLLPKDCISLKVLKEPMSPETLLGHLRELELSVYDPALFNSQHFCEYLFGLIDGETTTGTGQASASAVAVQWPIEV
ncbi:unnamed protein product, partial [Polarella glacialis]